MGTFEATFDIESRADAYAIERVTERLYDVLREESKSAGGGTAEAAEILGQFATVRDAARRRRPGRLTVVYEPREEPFDG